MLKQLPPSIGAILMLLFATPWTNGAETNTSVCVANPTEACILEAAEAALSSIEDERAWITAVAEVAAAAAETGRSGRARQLLDGAAERLASLPPTDEASALHELADAYRTSGAADRAADLLSAAERAQNQIDDLHKRTDLIGKWIVLRAKHGAISRAVDDAMAMSQADDNLAAYKARTLHELAPLQARAGDLDGAASTLDAITMSIPYYQSVARSDVAVIAAEAGRAPLAAQHFRRAEDIARGQDDGYFVAGALRQLADAYSRLGRKTAARRFFTDSAVGARLAKSVQERARALSRVATSLADHQLYDSAYTLVEEASGVAAEEPAEMLRAWTFYEIGGAAAFSGDFAAAGEALKQIPASVEFSGVSVRSAALRDIAWGHAKHGELSEAVRSATRIKTGRERAQAYARILRLMADPSMFALPRYL